MPSNITIKAFLNFIKVLQEAWNNHFAYQKIIVVVESVFNFLATLLLTNDKNNLRQEKERAYSQREIGSCSLCTIKVGNTI